MSRTESIMLALRTPLPPFELPDVVSGQTISPPRFADKRVVLVMFLCPHCPYVVHVQQGIARLGRDYDAATVAIIAISSNDAVTYPSDSPAGMRQQAQTLGFTFPYCYDESQDVARAFEAVATPEFYVFDGDRRLVYRGQFDESRRHTAIPVTGHHVRSAIDNTLAGLPIDPNQRPSMGCSIKWKL